MTSGNFFEWLGGVIGAIIRGVVHLLGGILGGIGHAVREFTNGLANALGIHSSAFNIALLVVGLLMLVAGVRALLRRSFLGGIIWLALAVLLLGNLIAY